MSDERPPRTLTTERLALRPFETADAAEVARLADDARISDTLFELPRPYGLGDALEWIGSHESDRANDRRYTFAVCLRGPGTLVGSIALTLAGPDAARAELGYWTGGEHWGRGYASEAATAVLAFGFDALGLQRIEARHLVRNPASGRVMRNAGMLREALLRAYLRDPRTGRVEDMEQWAVVRTDAVARPAARVATVAVLVHDYDAARDWFVNALGFRLVQDVPLAEPNADGAAKRWLVVEPPGGGSRLLLARASSHEQRSTVGRQGGGRVWLFLETGDFARDRARMVAAGVHFDEPPRRETYGTVAVFRDLCGNPWDLIEPARS